MKASLHFAHRAIAIRKISIAKEKEEKKKLGDFDGRISRTPRYNYCLLITFEYITLVINAHTISCAIIIVASFTARCQLFLTLP